LENKKSPLVLDQASKEVVERLLSRVSPKTDELIAICVQAHCQHGGSIDLTSKHQAFFSDSLRKTFHYFKIIFLGQCLALWKKFMMNNALRTEKNCQHDFNV
jgi:hypothetical protein